ncbi:Ig-like domain-containing protein [Aeromonas sp. RU39B]|uniref:Ig-like domain-containing protein n=1 Tax=Aeromonas sp. RU39B TaxID=1907416 RepID=UPI001C4BAD64|nr:Ig-like domain-containing protein [Aeromonas sp. RU39B]
MTNGTVEIAADGSISFVPAANFNGEISFDYVARDADGDTDTATVSIQVAAQNDFPTISGPGSVVTTEDTPHVFTWAEFKATDVDTDTTGLSVVINASSLQGGGALQQYINGAWVTLTGSVTITQAEVAAGHLRFVPAEDASGSNSYSGTGVGDQQADYAKFSYQVTDGSSTSDSASMSVDVTAVADAPSLTLALTDSGTTTGSGSALVINLGSAGTVVISNHAVVSETISGEVITYGGSNTSWSSTSSNPLGSEHKVDVVAVIGEHYFTGFNGQNTDYIYFDKDASHYTLSGVNTHTGSGTDGQITDKDTGKTMSFNNIAGIIFADGTVVPASAEVTTSFTDTTHLYNLSISAGLTDTDGSETLSVITLSGIPSSITLTAGYKDSNGNWILTQSQLNGLQMKVPSSYTSSFVLTASVTSTESSNGDSETTTQSITVALTHNDAPVAVSDTGSVNEDATLTVAAGQGVLANDHDANQDSLQVTAVRTGSESSSGNAGTIGSALAGTYGTLILNADGSYSYVADKDAADQLKAGQTATDSFTYTVSDGKGGTDTATLTITVTGTNDGPIAANDTGSVNEDATLSVSASAGVLANDSDVDGGTLTVIAVRTGTETGTGTSGTVGTALSGTYGTLTLNANGSYSYVADKDAADQLKAGQTATDSFTYTVSDGKGGTDTATLTITVTGTNDGPVAVNDTGSVNEDATLSVSASAGVLANDSDVDGGTLTVIAVRTGTETGTGTSGTVGTSLSGTYGTLTLNANGSYSYVADKDAADQLKAGQTATETFTYTVSDGQGGTDTATLTITVTGTNDAPVVATTNAHLSEEGLAGGNKDAVGTSDQGDSAAATGSIKVTDVDGDSAKVTLTGPSGLTSHGTAVTWSWNADTLTLVGVAGTTTVMTVVLSLTSANTWSYTVTQSASLDHADKSVEDVLNLTIGVSVDDQHGSTVGSSFVVSVEDDSPTLTDSSGTATSLTSAPTVLSGTYSLTGYSGSHSEIDFKGFTITATGFGGGTTSATTMTKVDLFGTSAGIGVASTNEPYYDLDSEVDYRLFKDGTGASEQIVVQLDNNTLAYGVTLDLSYFFSTDSGGAEIGVIEFWRNGVLVASNRFSSNSVSGQYDASFTYAEGGFDKVIIKAANNGNGYGDNSDFTVKGISFIGVSEAAIAYTSGQVSTSAGADGLKSLVLAGTDETGLTTAAGEAVTVTQSGNTITGKDDSGDLVFTLQFTPSTGQWDFYQYQKMTATSDGDLDFKVTITDSDGDSYTGAISVTPQLSYVVTEGTAGNNSYTLTNAQDLVVGDQDGSVVVPGKSYNIAFIVDSSGSIGDGSMTTIKDQLKSIFTSLKESVGADGSGTVNIMLVDFDTMTHSTVSVNLKDSSALSKLQAVIDSMSSGGGTNYEDAFQTVANWFSSSAIKANTGASNITYFITDGKPTYYVESQGDDPIIAYNWWGNAIYLSDVTKNTYVPGQVYKIGDFVVIDASGAVYEYERDNNVDGYVRSDGHGGYVYYSIGGNGNTTTNTVTTNSEDGFSLLTRLGVKVEAIGIGDSISTDDLKKYDSDGVLHTGVDVKNLATTILGTSVQTLPGSDTLHGGAGNDIIFGDAVHFSGVDGQGDTALKNYVASATGVSASAVTDEQVHTYITNHASDFDQSFSNDQGDQLYGDDGNDILFGQGGDDSLWGGSGNDLLFGGSGADKLYGEVGSDSLYGGSGNDTLDGGAGADTLQGGLGNDILTGSGDADTFVWKQGDATTSAPAKDTITDFNKSEGDKLDLSDLLDHDGSKGITELKSLLSIDEQSDGVHVHVKASASSTTDVQEIVLQNTKLSTLVSDTSLLSGSSSEISSKVIDDLVNHSILNIDKH